MLVADTNFWEEFVSSSQELRQPCHYPGFFAGEPVSIHDFEEVFRAATRQPSDSGLTIRVYVDGGHRADDYERVMTNGPAPDESLQDWAARLFGERKFGIVLNGAESVSESLSRQVARFLDPFFARRGVPYGGIDVAFFVGNYGFTPFGIHVDDRTHVLHAHLGPGTKEMSLWDPATYQQHRGSLADCYEPESMLPFGQTFAIRPQDLFYLPAGYFHVGNTPRFSVALAVSFIELSNKELLELAVLEEIHAQSSQLGTRLSPISDDRPAAAWSAAADANVPLPTWLRQSVVAYRLGLLSNHGLRQSPELVPCDPDTLPGRSLATVKPFRMYLHERDGQAPILLVRRRRLPVLAHLRVPSLLARLDEGEVLAVDDVVRELSGQCSGSDVTAWLASLVAAGGVEILAP